jgi:hypothetical protein
VNRTLDSDPFEETSEIFAGTGLELLIPIHFELNPGITAKRMKKERISFFMGFGFS